MSKLLRRIIPLLFALVSGYLPAQDLPPPVTITGYYSGAYYEGTIAFTYDFVTNNPYLGRIG